ncbi:ABC transporter ATP-binding protein [Roseovarius pelagicus]|uniref:ABC transporter ATP-binding protein n=1 Tax=Roseovarius pelagicus TaxID=2980108 RepID=A0ABY6D5T8_9RHOB|nr:ABC transporter ATP-binding protein [Roseovarius pelagicus]UXX81511.1 ABC transporter ATP-binding protein [Roseovarius pelagicus]
MTDALKHIALEVRELSIEAKGADKRWFEIVKGVSFKLNKGEVLGLIGESGAGKSTIGLSALGYRRPGCRFSGGQVLFKGKDLLTMNPEELRQMRGARVSYVAQSAAAFFNPAHRLIDQFIEAGQQHDQGSRSALRSEAIELYRTLGLPSPQSFGERYPHQVSGGQLQRAMVAMSMACKPDVIVFDEPTTALDVTTQAEVVAAIKRTVSKSGVAALYISHDLPVVSQVVDRIMVLRHGKQVEIGKTSEILSNPQAEYTKELLQAEVRENPARERTTPILGIQNIVAGYGSEKVLGGVSCTAMRGRTLAIVGESGSGKSTLGRVVTGVLAPWSGEVTFDGAVLPKRLKSREINLLKRIQVIHQMPDTALNPMQRVGDVIGRPLKYHRKFDATRCRQEVIELMRQVGLPVEMMNRRTSQLSGGQKQRVCIARALASAPDLIICDEITSGLDPLVAESILVLLSDLQRKHGTTILFITHDIHVVEMIADDVLVLRAGKVVAYGPRDETLKQSDHPYVRTLMESVPRLDRYLTTAGEENT